MKRHRIRDPNATMNRHKGSRTLAKLQWPVASDRLQTANELISFIRVKNLKIGDRVPSIRQIARALKISYTVARDALNQVQAMGFVKIHPRSGTFVRNANVVTPLSAMEDECAPNSDKNLNLADLLVARQIIEPEVVSHAVQPHRLDDLQLVRQALDQIDFAIEHDQLSTFLDGEVLFHWALARATGNSIFVAVVQWLAVAGKAILLQLGINSKQMRLSQEDHKDIYRAIMLGDVPSARSAMLRYLNPGHYFPTSIDKLSERRQIGSQER